MSERFGQISTGALAEEDNVRQGFLDTEQHLNVLNNMSTETKEELQNYKEDLGNEISSALTSLTSSTSVENLTSSSSNADIVAALQNTGTEITNIVTALQNMFAKVKGLS